MELIVQDGADSGKRYNLSNMTSSIQEPVLIGRDPSSSLAVNDSQISRRHAQIENRNGEIFITDLGSANGSFINGQRLASSAPQPLKPGDKLKLGNTNFEVAGTVPPPYPSAPIQSPGYIPPYPYPNNTPQNQNFNYGVSGQQGYGSPPPVQDSFNQSSWSNGGQNQQFGNQPPQANLFQTPPQYGGPQSPPPPYGAPLQPNFPPPPFTPAAAPRKTNILPFALGGVGLLVAAIIAFLLLNKPATSTESTSIVNISATAKVSSTAAVTGTAVQGTAAINTAASFSLPTSNSGSANLPTTTPNVSTSSTKPAVAVTPKPTLAKSVNTPAPTGSSGSNSFSGIKLSPGTKLSPAAGGFVLSTPVPGATSNSESTGVSPTTAGALNKPTTAPSKSESSSSSSGGSLSGNGFSATFPTGWKTQVQNNGATLVGTTTTDATSIIIGRTDDQKSDPETLGSALLNQFFKVQYKDLQVVQDVTKEGSFQVEYTENGILKHENVILYPIPEKTTTIFIFRFSSAKDKYSSKVKIFTDVLDSFRYQV